MGDNVDKHVKYIPKRLSEYRERDYWDHRYAQEQHAYEWFFPYQHIQHLLDPYLKPFQRILILGCGNSSNNYYPFTLYHIPLRFVTGTS